MDEIEEADSVEDYARLLAKGCIEGKTKQGTSDREPTLFGLFDQ
jgi:ribosomal protein L19E